MNRRIKYFLYKAKSKVVKEYYRLVSSGHIRIVSVSQGKNSSIKTFEGGYISAKDGLTVRQNTTMHSFGGIIEMGRNVFFNTNCNIICRKSIRIGNNVSFGPNVSIYDHNHDYNTERGILGTFTSSEIVIEDYCWIGATVVILPNTHIGEGCVIGANTVVKGNIPPHSIVTQTRELNIRPIEKT